MNFRDLIKKPIWTDIHWFCVISFTIFSMLTCCCDRCAYVTVTARFRVKTERNSLIRGQVNAFHPGITLLHLEGKFL